jgi:flagellar biosynthesis/type III secretory pathway protein FliH
MTQELADLQVLIDVLVSVLRRRRAKPGAHSLHVHPDDLHRYRLLAAHFYGVDGRTLEDLVGLPVHPDPSLAAGEIELWP